MKKIIILTLSLFTIGLCADQIDFETYQKNPNPKNFIATYQSTVEDSNAVMTSYILLSEMERQLSILEEDLENMQPKGKFQYANLLLALNRFDKATEIYDIINKDFPKWSCPWRHKGEAYFKAGELEEAEIAVKKAIETRETHYDAYIMLADIQFNMGKNKKALETIEKGFTYKGKDIEDPEEEVSTISTKILYLKILRANNKTEKFSKLREELKEKYPENSEIKNF